MLLLDKVSEYRSAIKDYMRMTDRHGTAVGISRVNSYTTAIHMESEQGHWELVLKETNNSNAIIVQDTMYISNHGHWEYLCHI